MGVLLAQLNEELAGRVAAVARGLVRISTGTGASGSGIICHPAGLIVTNAHLVGRGMIQVRVSDGLTLPARVRAVAADHDLAALSVRATGLAAVDFGYSRQSRPGELVFALGHPWGIEGGVTAGVIIGVGSDLPENPAPGREWIAATVRLRPGHSGGPLVDVAGRLLGVNAMMAGPEVGLAVPVHVVKHFLRSALLPPEKSDDESQDVSQQM